MEAAAREAVGVAEAQKVQEDAEAEKVQEEAEKRSLIFSVANFVSLR